ncbi:MAG TPA: UbiA family prenyltransferase, partial [Bacteroidia bacterium]|nr:UbiA family prenyltransferase [Bacteroidia bacterium]
MNPIKIIVPLWKLIRGNNLLIICLIFLLVRHTIVLPVLSFSASASELGNGLFLLLMLATVLVAAGGNIINDYFDMAIDAINKPGQKVLGMQVHKKTGILLYSIFTIAGIGLAGFVSYKINTYRPFIIFPASALILFLYSYSYKSVMLAGNILIAILSGITVALPVLFDNGA